VVNYFTVASTWVNFDDVEVIKEKVSYAKKNGLLGYSVFQVGNDDNWVLSMAGKFVVHSLNCFSILNICPENMTQLTDSEMLKIFWL
jgi:GH18 family chitinase